MNMEYSTEITLKNVCCTCLSVDRKLTQLCRVNNGVNNLFFLLSYKPEAYETMFVEDATQLFICWECSALMRKLSKFRDQVYIAQKCLSDITDGKVNIKSKLKCLSKLSYTQQISYSNEIIVDNEPLENFVDCGPDVDNIKAESDTDDIPLAEFGDIDNVVFKREPKQSKTEVNEVKVNKIKNNIKKRKIKNINTEDELKKDYFTIQMLEDEMLENIKLRKLEDSYANAVSKCESCVEGFNDYNELERHNLKLHKQKPKYVQCDICKVYVKCKWLLQHRNEHYLKYQCGLCEQICYSTKSITHHLKTEHSIHRVYYITGQLKKVRPKKLNIDSGSSTMNLIIQEESCSLGYLCTECNKYFQNKNQRYKHIQIHHREGFECSTCGKKFPFKNTLRRHEQIHGKPLPREQCPICGKMVRKDLMKPHAQIHTEREGFDCVACGKRFVSRASYENHLKHTRSHVSHDVLKYKCSICGKYYRSPGELRDHINYIHMGKTQHKCPICEKALATRRCITRHVRRAHHGVKENAKDKICQTCGKAFREKKSLREHELIHTGERPLTCDICSRTFRQSASLYTHRRRVHNIAPKQKLVEHTDSVINHKMLLNCEINASNG